MGKGEGPPGCMVSILLHHIALYGSIIASLNSYGASNNNSN